MPAPGDIEIIDDTDEYQRVRTYSAAGYTEEVVWKVARPAPVLTADEKLAQARATLDALDALSAPVLTADVVDLLDDLRSVL